MYDMTANQQALLEIEVTQEGDDVATMLSHVADAQTALSGTTLNEYNPVVKACLKVVEAFGEEHLNPHSVQRGKDLDAAVRRLKSELARIR